MVGETRVNGNVHVDRCEGAMSEGAAEGTGKSKASVEIKALGSLLLRDLSRSRGSGSHCGSSDMRGTRHGRISGDGTE